MPSIFDQTIPELSCLFGVPLAFSFVPINELRTLGLISLFSFVKWVGLNPVGIRHIEDNPISQDPDTSVADEAVDRTPIHCS